MDAIERIRKLELPEGIVDVILDTDAYNEIDDQYAISYMVRCREKINTKAIYAAPFFNHKCASPKEGMQKSHDEIKKILDLAGVPELKETVFRGAERFMAAQEQPVVSPAVEDLTERAMKYSKDRPLYVIGIGAITNIASAILINPEIIERIVVIWLGGNSWHSDDNKEFNMKQDVNAARVVFDSGVPLVQVPCLGVAEHFTISKPELEYWLKGKNQLCDYLAEITIAEMDSCRQGLPWSKPIWDVTAIAWLLGGNQRFMEERIEPSPIPGYNHYYSFDKRRHPIKYVYRIHRDALLKDLFDKLWQS